MGIGVSTPEPTSKAWGRRQEGAVFLVSTLTIPWSLESLACGGLAGLGESKPRIGRVQIIKACELLPRVHNSSLRRNKQEQILLALRPSAPGDEVTFPWSLACLVHTQHLRPETCY